MLRTASWPLPSARIRNHQVQSDPISPRKILYSPIQIYCRFHEGRNVFEVRRGGAASLAWLQKRSEPDVALAQAGRSPSARPLPNGGDVLDFPAVPEVLLRRSCHRLARLWRDELQVARLLVLADVLADPVNVVVEAGGVLLPDAPDFLDDRVYRKFVISHDPILP